VADLGGKVVLVTGAAQGLGAAICQELADAGATLAMADRNDAVHAFAEKLRSPQRPLYASVCDVGDAEDVERMFAQLDRECGRLDAIVNNAGTDVTKSVNELTVAEWERVLRTNLSGPFFVSKAALPRFQRQGSGDIVNIASTAAKRAWPNASAYHASKWGLMGLSQSMLAEFRELGIRVTTVVAGGMRTPFLLDRFPELDPAKLQDPRNVARAVVFALTQPRESVIAEITVLPVTETSWP
jgi:NAD(P)-dependent dehydrogenase (short-subunit alcohol dehydrogenase family)